MTHSEFNNHRFSISTEVQFRGEWVRVIEVEFKEGWLGLENGYYLRYNDSEIGGIRDANNAEG